jgi:hypothetical protein
MSFSYKFVLNWRLQNIGEAIMDCQLLETHLSLISSFTDNKLNMQNWMYHGNNSQTPMIFKSNLYVINL